MSSFPIDVEGSPPDSQLANLYENFGVQRASRVESRLFQQFAPYALNPKPKALRPAVAGSPAALEAGRPVPNCLKVRIRRGASGPQTAFLVYLPAVGVEGRRFSVIRPYRIGVGFGGLGFRVSLKP